MLSTSITCAYPQCWNEPKYIQNGPEMKEISSKCLKYFCLLGGCYTCIGLHPYWYHNCLCMCMHWKGWKLSTKHCSLSLYTTALLQPQCSECQFGPVRSFATKSYKYYELWLALLQDTSESWQQRVWGIGWQTACPTCPGLFKSWECCQMSVGEP